jgi:hypothetical protein
MKNLPGSITLLGAAIAGIVIPAGSGREPLSAVPVIHFMVNAKSHPEPGTATEA